MSVNQHFRVCDMSKENNNLKNRSDFHSAITERYKLRTGHQRAKVVIRLAHISKKSMV